MERSLVAAICADVVRPSLIWLFTGGKHLKLVQPMVAIRDPAGFAELRQRCSQDPHITPTGMSHVLSRIAVVLAAKGGTIRDVTIGDFLERAALVHGDARVAVVDEPGVAGSLGAITYAEMHDRARGMALAFDAMGVGHGERVAIVSPNSARFLISYFGVSGFGRVLVPVNFRLNADEVAYIVEHSGASVLLVDPEIDASLAGVSAKVRLLLDGEEAAELFAPGGAITPPP